MFNDKSDIITLLSTRRSGKARDMQAPGPNAEELEQILQAGMRVPDHGKIAPWRFIIVQKQKQAALGQAFADAYLAEKPDAGKLELEAIQNFPTQAPVMVVVLSTPNLERSIPEWEQRLSAGAACQNMLLAAHGLGYLGNWLTGWAAYSDSVLQLLGGGAHDKIAGFLFFGQSDKELQERPRPDYDDVVSLFNG